MQGNGKVAILGVAGFVTLLCAVFVWLLNFLKSQLVQEQIEISSVYLIVKGCFFAGLLATSLVVWTNLPRLLVEWASSRKRMGKDRHAVGLMLLLIMVLFAGIWIPFFNVGFEDFIREFFYPEKFIGNVSLFNRDGYEFKIAAVTKRLPAAYLAFVSLPLWISALKPANEESEASC
jgi:hypothetical protein